MVNVSKSSSPMENMGGQNYPSPSSKPSCSHTLGFGVVKTGGCFHVNPEKKNNWKTRDFQKNSTPQILRMEFWVHLSEFVTLWRIFWNKVATKKCHLPLDINSILLIFTNRDTQSGWCIDIDPPKLPTCGFSGPSGYGIMESKNLGITIQNCSPECPSQFWQVD